MKKFDVVGDMNHIRGFSFIELERRSGSDAASGADEEIALLFGDGHEIIIYCHEDGRIILEAD